MCVVVRCHGEDGRGLGRIARDRSHRLPLSSRQANPLRVLYTTALFEEYGTNRKREHAPSKPKPNSVTISFPTIRFKQYNNRQSIFVEVNDGKTQNIIGHRENGATMD